MVKKERERERETLKYGKFAASPYTNVTRSRGDTARLSPLSLSFPLSLTDDSRFEIGARASVLRHFETNVLECVELRGSKDTTCVYSQTEERGGQQVGRQARYVRTTRMIEMKK